MAKEWANLVLERVGGGVVRLNFNRPAKRNALSLALTGEILDALETVRADPDVRVVITRGNGPCYCAGADLNDLRAIHAEPPGDWDRSHPNMMFYESFRNYPKVTIAQVHGHCLGGGMALMTAHDIAIAADTAKIGMPEIVRGSFGQMALSSLYHTGITAKKAALMHYSGRNFSGTEADRFGLVSASVPEAELDAVTLQLAKEIGSRHPAALASAKIAVQMGKDLPLSQAMRTDQLVAARQQLMMDTFSDVEEYLRSQSGGTNTGYRRSDT